MAKLKLLIIDDDLAYSQMLADYFKRFQFDVAIADNFEDAMAAFRRKRPPVVLLDFNMPLINGDKFLPLLQEIDPRVRVIVISGYTQEDVEEKFKGSGYFAFFSKGGSSLEEIRQKVDEASQY